MKKQEIIHLHKLFDLALNELDESLESEDNNQNSIENSNEIISDYAGSKVAPTTIHKSKTDHKQALFKLLYGITEEVSDSSKPSRTEEVLTHLLEDRGSYVDLAEVSDGALESDIEVLKAAEYLEGEYEFVDLVSYQKAKLGS